MRKTDNFNVTLNTSIRSHGKWGDFLVALIPLSWCGNILLNSNFILRMIEWQNESSLFVIRIQGKQWYWVYKYSGDTNFRINNTYINVGNNNWLKQTSFSQSQFDYQNSLISYIFDYEFKKVHQNRLRSVKLTQNALNKNNLFTQNFNNSKLQKNVNSIVKVDYLTSYTKNKFYNFTGKITKTKWKGNKNLQQFFYKKFYYYYTPNKVHFTNNTNFLYIQKRPFVIKINKFSLFTNYLNGEHYSHILKTCFKLKKKNYHTDIVLNLKKTLLVGKKSTIFDSTFKPKLKLNSTFNLFNKALPVKGYFDSDKFDNTFVSSENFRQKFSKFPIKLNKTTLNKHITTQLKNTKTLNKNLLLNYKLTKSETVDKISHVEQFWGFRQKKYKKLRSFSFQKNTKYSNVTYRHLENFIDSNFNKYFLYSSVKNNKYKNELIPVTLARRLLRTKRTLVLPVHVNITLITNSYDVVHSWFVPGLGLKIDCVPGRSTHHSLYIDNVGFYYGQCAEICGRYHHHMPIRVCALPYEHFLLWWQTKGLPRMYRSEKFLQNKSILLNKFKY